MAKGQLLLWHREVGRGERKGPAASHPHLPSQKCAPALHPGGLGFPRRASAKLPWTNLSSKPCWRNTLDGGLLSSRSLSEQFWRFPFAVRGPGVLFPAEARKSLLQGSFSSLLSLRRIDRPFPSPPRARRDGSDRVCSPIPKAITKLGKSSLGCMGGGGEIFVHMTAPHLFIPNHPCGSRNKAKQQSRLLLDRARSTLGSL